MTRKDTQWDHGRWVKHLREARSALKKRDVIDRNLEGAATYGSPEEALRERSAWASRAKAHLRRLAVLAETAPNPHSARGVVGRLSRWQSRSR
ncbi:hypothetical protein [Thiohalorhabdus methylotrophus]|uniref:Uncharacterized protein n=1 Tax=Thiohalorhabdus methylotrophus TaxID=3242694 RepID=A0ABV4TXN0_9GAMM